MILFEVVKRKLAIMAIMPIPKENLPAMFGEFQMILNWMHVGLVFIVLLTYFLAPLYYLLFKANTFAEYIEVTFMVAVTLLKVMLYAILIWKRFKLLNLQVDIENIIKLSKFENFFVSFIHFTTEKMHLFK